MADQAPHGGDYDSSTDDDSTVTTVASDQPVLTVLMALRVCQFTEAEATSLIAQAIPDWHVIVPKKGDHKTVCQYIPFNPQLQFYHW